MWVFPVMKLISYILNINQELIHIEGFGKIFSVYECLLACMCVYHVHEVTRETEGGHQIPLRLEFHMVVS